MLVRNNSTTRAHGIGLVVIYAGQTAEVESIYYDDISLISDLEVLSGAPTDGGLAHDAGPVSFDKNPVTNEVVLTGNGNSIGGTGPTSADPQWVDVDFPIIIRTSGPSIPTLEILQGNITAPQWSVNDFNMCEGQELIHGWLEGSEFRWHAHVITNGTDTTARYLKWEIEWCYAVLGQVLSAPMLTTSADIVIPANTTAKTHIIQMIGSATIPATIGTQVFARLKRVTATGAAPTRDPWCSMLQIHIQCNTVGSSMVSEK